MVDLVFSNKVLVSIDSEGLLNISKRFFGSKLKFAVFLFKILILSWPLYVIVKDVEEIKEHFDKERKEELVNNLYFLNFNYTPIAKIYSDLLGKDDRTETTFNFIHGEIDNKKENKIKQNNQNKKNKTRREIFSPLVLFFLN